MTSRESRNKCIKIYSEWRCLMSMPDALWISQVLYNYQAFHTSQISHFGFVQGVSTNHLSSPDDAKIAFYLCNTRWNLSLVIEGSFCWSGVEILKTLLTSIILSFWHGFLLKNSGKGRYSSQQRPPSPTFFGENPCHNERIGHCNYKILTALLLYFSHEGQ